MLVEGRRIGITSPSSSCPPLNQLLIGTSWRKWAHYGERMAGFWIITCSHNHPRINFQSAVIWNLEEESSQKNAHSLVRFLPLAVFLLLRYTLLPTTYRPHLFHAAIKFFISFPMSKNHWLSQKQEEKSVISGGGLSPKKVRTSRVKYLVNHWFPTTLMFQCEMILGWGINSFNYFPQWLTPNKKKNKSLDQEHQVGPNDENKILG